VICRDTNTWTTTGYLWDCNDTGGANAPLVIKIGWISRFNDRADVLRRYHAAMPALR
jgi:type IV pilus assembly protein PilV